MPRSISATSSNASHALSSESTEVAPRTRGMADIYASTSRMPSTTNPALTHLQLRSSRDSEAVKAAHTLVDPKAANAAEILVAMSQNKKA